MEFASGNKWKAIIPLVMASVWSLFSLTEEHLTEKTRTPQVNMELDPHWDDFKSRYNKTFNRNTEAARRLAWEQNLIRIIQHNEEAAAGKHNYTLRDNHLSDMDPNTYAAKMIKLRHSGRRRRLPEETLGTPVHDPEKIPEEFDWREKGFETPAWNQEDCGACYAFAVSSTVSGQIFKEAGVLRYLSVQQIVDCSGNVGNLGCGGGSLRNTLKYIQGTGGLETYKDYPYKAKQETCQFKKDKAVVRVISWAVLPPRDEHALKVAVWKVGPIAVSLNASPATFQLYHSGVYDDPECSSDFVNHAMLLVGYTKDSWILRNWWSDEWGEKGYMYLKRGANRCAISNYAAYAHIDKYSLKL
ncbi:unnamed protein product [Bemisia tabaci]|uniref:Cathepsin L1-like n=1 Tax=Bemisia tabaci TaxID=7038 RepID=A0A9P0AH29_BEMTA|nr:unnamed protein product [Bemisia tabaci]